NSYQQVSIHWLLTSVFPLPLLLLLHLLRGAAASSGSGYDYGDHPRFICTPVPADADPSCFPTAGPGGSSHQSAPPAGWRGASEEAKATILHLRESLVQQRETILDQRETIRELTAKLALCEGFSRGVTPHDDHHGSDLNSHHAEGAGHHLYTDERPPSLFSSSQRRNTSASFSSSLKELLQRKVSSLEQQLHHDSDHRDPHDGASHHDAEHPDDHGEGHRTGHHRTGDQRSSQKSSRTPDSFQLSFPIRTNYMYGQVKRTLLQEIFAFTLCLWMRTDKDQSIGTPFSYSAPGQANELVLIEWGDNPLELLVDDKAVTLPLSLSDGQRHHVCVTWSTRDGQWEAYQDGVQRGAGNNLSPWRPIKPGGVFILGQEQDILGGRFDATQSFVGEMSDVHMWSHVLSATDIHSLASCGSYLRGDVIAWSDTEVELHGGVSKIPFDPCH
uniref:Neuronal pentraxin-2-like n=1 Tax=Cynoglossus semilaevis TaxID=244447 RepID=A0A3P8USY9_CYNSE